MINKQIKNNKGFTLVETMFAVMILTFVIVGMMTVVASSLFSARYAKDEITANYLLQEVVDYIRNDRDTTVFLQSGDVSTAWNTFANRYTANCSNQATGCYFDVLNAINASPVTPTVCSSSSEGCPNLCYNEEANNTSYYSSEGAFGCGTGIIRTNFERKIVITRNVENTDELNVFVTVSYLNGTLTKTRSLSTTIMKWQP